MTSEPKIRRLDAAAVDEHWAALSEVLMDCVDGGASVSFMAPFSQTRAEHFWSGVRDRVAAGAVEVLVAEVDDGIAGTVQLVLAQPENQPHRADLAKLLVHRRARKRGVGRGLMVAAEHLARQRGKTLLVLDTASAEAERLYNALGWIEVGRVPGYALFPDGRPCDTIIFYKQLAPWPAGQSSEGSSS